MSIDLWKTLGLAALALLTAPAMPAVAATPASIISAADLRADLHTVIEAIEKNHPDLEHRVDKAALDRTTKSIERELDRPMDRTQAWSVLAQLNPVLADGHLLIGLPDWRASAAAATEQGAPWFPFEVSSEASGHLRLIALLGGAQSADAGRFVSRINGVPAKEVVRTLLNRTHGDTPSARAALLSQRWWLFYSKVYGTPATFNLEFADRRGREQLAASRKVLPAVLQRDASFERLFRCEIRSAGAVLTVSTFSWPDKARFFAFTEACFTKMARERVRRLVIDIRANGGGDDDMWRDGILRYIADQPYRHGSRYIKRVLTPGPGELAGQLVEGTIESVTEPATGEPARFMGEVSVLVGPLTYSSAVLFSNVVQDYRFGNVVGVGRSVRTRQTGGVKTLILPNTGLLLSYPRFVLDRPSGAQRPKWLTPDRQTADDPLNPEAAIDALLGTKD
ncbi:S41 family peptidase [Xanthomonas vesicatoria]|uniref:S41 family peptidase n=1 Tax=Xanthomonas vesicatoria TaxID=56460 RepID=UPI001E4391D5|nr:S41 family peptidase [Xanthomonas vesicatoria]MCC8619448.1 hypothetical protein [Xanthomonas vesicatoria]MCC8633098.1 hypothetical protein [Xanthomonas vesicatoria]